MNCDISSLISSISRFFAFQIRDTDTPWSGGCHLGMGSHKSILSKESPLAENRALSSWWLNQPI